MPRAENISFNRHGARVQLSDPDLIRFWIRTIAKAHQTKIKQLTYVFCSDRFLLEMNKEYLSHHYLTDIITFDLRDGAMKEDIEGEIYISVDRVRYNAGAFGTSFKSELHRVIIHGVLHLLGYKDKTKSEKAIMRDKEDACLSLLHVPRGTMGRKAQVMFHVKQ